MMKKSKGVGWASKARKSIAAAVLLAVMALPGTAFARTVRYPVPTKPAPIEVVEPIDISFSLNSVSWS